MNDPDMPTKLPLCPFLGSRRDMDTIRNYPTGSNVCHAQTSYKRQSVVFLKKRPYKHVSGEDQRKICLCPDEWPNCPGYLAKKKAET